MLLINSLGNQCCVCDVLVVFKVICVLEDYFSCPCYFIKEQFIQFDHMFFLCNFVTILEMCYAVNQ